ncbi:pyridoxamine 5'-phosphate oxidase [Kibdelosporangium phytohabitans]|uniref:Pyridoxamine 5'-phosphate oxidase n=2 Tax=Kibdelosporangium phytohabitans TaxID=860235 RepID=A0A0N9IEW0_9PSEU|nr:TIGR03618 family F420-dependent PPOX class oxidoreductase [Kibdelosporangium phytohabitans]ALG15009.1 pyridoxamine 5'-phosphate oxidase [Kibdelosporangium phytohabitans]
MGTIIEPALADRLRGERNVWLCTLRPDGSPHVTPVWFVHTGETFWISSGVRNVKVRNIINDPRVSLALEDGDEPAVAEGQARVHHGPLRTDVLAAIAAKYDGWDAAAEVHPFGARVLVEVPVTRWLLTSGPTTTLPKVDQPS